MPGLYEKNINTHNTKLMRMDLQIDHELKNLIRPLTFDERNGLRDNLIQNGCHDSIKTWNGIIVDGHNRYEICNEQGIEYKTDELVFDSKDDVKVWMIRQQLDKRNVNDYTRTSLCLKLEGIFQEKAEANLKAGGQSRELLKQPLQNSANPKIKEIESVNTRQEIADIAHVSTDTVSKVKFIENHATDEQKVNLQNDKTSIHKVYNELKKPIVEVDLKEPIEEVIDTDYCKIIPFTPIKSQVVLCPCGCGYGYCWTNNTWYTQEQINELDEE